MYNKYHITTNSPEKFKCLGNVFPDNNTFDKVIYAMPNEFTFNLFSLIYNDSRWEIPLATEYLSHSRKKSLSTIIDDMIENGLQLNYTTSIEPFYSLKNEDYDALGMIIYGRFHEKWIKLQETLELKYNPIKPYDMSIEDTNENEVHSDTTITRNNTSNSSSNGSDSVEFDNTENEYYGFNSVTPVPTDKSKNTSSSSSTDSSNNVYNGTANTTHDKTENDTRNVKRSGNIGNITQQELIERERQVWKFQILDVIFKDIDSVLCSHTYE